MTAIAESLSRQFGGVHPFLRVASLVMLFALAGLGLGGYEMPPVVFLTVLASVAILGASARFPGFAVAFPLAVFSIMGIGLSSGLKLFHIEVNLADLLILSALIPTAMRALTGRLRPFTPSVPAILMGIWLLMAAGFGYLQGNSLDSWGNEIHVLIYMPLAYLFAVAALNTRDDLRLLAIIIIAAAAIAGLKAGYVSLFLPHMMDGLSYVWQATTFSSAELGGQRTILNGADTMFVLVVPILAAVAIFRFNRRTILLLLVAGVPVFFGLLVSLTRTNWATVILAILIVGLLGSIYSGKKAAAVTASAFILGGIIFLGVSSLTLGTSRYNLGELMLHRLESDASTGSGNLDYRIQESQALLASLEQNQIFGKGLGSSFSFLEFRGSPATTWAHNGPLWVLLKSGLAGFAIFTLAILLTVWQLIRTAWRAGTDWIYRTVPIGFAASLVALAAMSLLVNRIANPEGAYFIGLALAMPQVLSRILIDCKAERSLEP